MIDRWCGERASLGAKRRRTDRRLSSGTRPSGVCHTGCATAYLYVNTPDDQRPEMPRSGWRSVALGTRDTFSRGPVSSSIRGYPVPPMLLVLRARVAASWGRRRLDAVSGLRYERPMAASVDSLEFVADRQIVMLSR